MFVRWNFTVWGSIQTLFAIAAFEVPLRDRRQDLDLAERQARLGGRRVWRQANRRVGGLVDCPPDHPREITTGLTLLTT